MAGRRRDPLILALHGIENVPVRDDPNRLFLAPSALRSLVERVAGWGYRFATFGDLALAVERNEAQGLAALTFDDGYRNNLYELVPILQQTKAVATVFVVTDWLGKMHPDRPHRPILSETEVRVLHGEGVEIGSHTVTHKDLTTLNRSLVASEFKSSKEILEDILQSPVNVMAYPFGNANEQTRAAAREAGFVAACRTSGRGAWTDLLDLPREDIGNRATRVGMELKRRGAYEPLMHTLPGRVLRRAWYSVQKTMP